MKITQRRSFLKKAFSGILTLSFFPAAASTMAKPNKMENFMHVVFFWLKQPDKKSARKEFEKHLETLTKNIDVIKSAHVGTPAPTERSVIDNTYTYSLILGFKNKEDQDAYQGHPVHLDFVQNASPLWEKVVVYDSLEV
ncbi:MAG: Dabb family protein [Candidatus Cyclobacteriaceae bacterium M2_1C_046]